MPHVQICVSIQHSLLSSFKRAEPANVAALNFISMVDLVPAELLL